MPKRFSRVRGFRDTHFGHRYRRSFFRLCLGGCSCQRWSRGSVAAPGSFTDILALFAPAYAVGTGFVVLLLVPPFRRMTSRTRPPTRKLAR